MTYDTLDDLRASLRAEAEGDNGGYVELTSRDLLALLDRLTEMEAKLAQQREPAPITIGKPRDDLAAQRAKRQAIVHLRLPGSPMLPACGTYPAEHTTHHPEAITCTKCKALVTA